MLKENICYNEEPINTELINNVYDDNEPTNIIQIPNDENLLHRLPKAPLHLFEAKTQHLLLAVSKGKSVPLEMVICAFLSLGSCCLGRSRGVIYNNEWCEYANLFFLLIAETGLGKSHVFNYFFDEVRQADELLTRKWEEDWNKYQEELDDWKKSKKEERGDRPYPPLKLMNLVNDATMEAVVERLKHNPRGLFWEVDEFSGFFGRLDRYNKNGGGEGKSKLLTMWDSGKVASSRKNNDGVANEICIPKATVGMFGAIQPKLLKKTFTEDDLDQGVTQRFVFVFSEQFKVPKLPYPKIDSWVKDDITKIVNRLLSLNMSTNDIGSPEAEFLTLTESAKNEFNSCINRRNIETAHSEIAGYSAKMARITLRLALILHLLEWAISSDIDYSREIDVDVMESATELTDYFLKHSTKAHNILSSKGEDFTASQRLVMRIFAKNETKLHEFVNKDTKQYSVPAKILENILKDEKVHFTYKNFVKALLSFKDVKKIKKNTGFCYNFDEKFIRKCEKSLFLID